MQCVIKGVAAFMVCGLLAALFLPSIRSGGSYTPKTLPVNVKVIDTDEQAPVAGAEVTFVFSPLDSEPPLNKLDESNWSSAVTDAGGRAEVVGTFRARASRSANLTGGRDRWYRLGGGWLKVVAAGRPVAFVSLNGHNFGGERDYDNNEPLEVTVVMNKAPTLSQPTRE